MASLKKIASDLGVSYTLVSKVLNGRMGTTGASAKTRAAILAKAKELNYVPNPLAVALKGGRKGAVAVFIHEMGTPGSEIASLLLRTVAAGLNRTHTRMWLQLFMSDVEFMNACDDSILRTMDGMIVAGVEHAALVGKFLELERKGFPVVVVAGKGSVLRDLEGYVRIDTESQGFLPTEHLLHKGCKRIANFSGSHSLRHTGYLRAHRESGLRVDERLIVELNSYSIQSGKEGVETLLSRKIPFDGIVAQSDAQALGAVHRLLEAGIKVPEDVKVTGVDDSPLATACVVPITSVTSSMNQAGTLAVDLLWRKLEAREVSTEVVHPCLVVRASSGF